MAAEGVDKDVRRLEMLRQRRWTGLMRSDGAGERRGEGVCVRGIRRARGVCGRALRGASTIGCRVMKSLYGTRLGSGMAIGMDTSYRTEVKSGTHDVKQEFPNPVLAISALEDGTECVLELANRARSQTWVATVTALLGAMHSPQLLEELGGVGKDGLDVERILMVEGEDLGGGDGVAVGEDDELGVVAGVGCGGVPLDLDGVRGDVVHVEVADAEDGGEHGAGECGATGDGLVLVEGGGEGFAGEDLFDAFANGGHAGDAADELDGVNVIEGDAGLGEGALEGCGDAVEDVGDEGLELFAGEL